MGIPHVVTDCQDFKHLSPTALKLLIMIARQYNGFNNGDLQATFTLAKQWGIASQQTLARKLKELQDSDLIQKTRDGWFKNPGRRCSLYAVTWQPIDECKGKLDVLPTKTPPRKFSMEKNTEPSTKFVAYQYRNCTEGNQERDQQGCSGYDNCSHTNIIPLPVATNNGDLNNIPGVSSRMRQGEQCV